MAGSVPTVKTRLTADVSDFTAKMKSAGDAGEKHGAHQERGRRSAGRWGREGERAIWRAKATRQMPAHYRIAAE